MTSFLDSLSAKVGAAFEKAGVDASYGRVVVSDRPDLAPFQCNGAMPAAKQAQKPPRAIAEAVKEELLKDPVFTSVEIAGPGFLNLKIAETVMKQVMIETLADPRFGTPVLSDKQKVVLDYGGPNVAKAMHVGHLRAAIIGDTLRRLYDFAGYDTLGDVHLGDWGTPMGMVISELEIRNPSWMYFDAAITSGYPEESPVTLADLEKLYPEAAAACKEDEARRARAQEATFDLQNGRAGYRALWKHFVKVSIDGMKLNFDALNVQFDLWKGESDVHDLIAPMVEKLQADGFAQNDDGAVVIPLAEEGDTKEIPPLILYKRDGAVMYGTTDLATIVERVRDYDPVKIIYTVDARQSLHFEQLFRAAHKSGIAKAENELIHTGYGTMNGTDGKPFKTRAGGVMRLEDLISMATAKASERLKEANMLGDASADEMADIAVKVAVASIRFADLQNQRQSDYIFDLDRLIRFEGKTGPYMLYQVVRIKSMLNKASSQNLAIGFSADAPLSEDELKLAYALVEWPEVFSNAVRGYYPHLVCDFVYKLAQAYSSFYAACPVLVEKDEAIRSNRLALSALTASMLETACDLLGMNIPERM